MIFWYYKYLFSSIYKIPNHSFSWHILESRVIQHLRQKFPFSTTTKRTSRSSNFASSCNILSFKHNQVRPLPLVDLLVDLDRVFTEAAAREIEALQSGDKLGVGLLAEGGQEYPDGLICNLTEAQVQPQQSREHLRKLFANLLINGILCILIDQVHESASLILD